MTEELKAKLHKVLMDVANDYANSVNPELDGTLYTGPDLETAFAQIDQAYKEAGYVQHGIIMRPRKRYFATGPGQIPPLEEPQQPCMTGQEWYDRYQTQKGFGSLDNLTDMPHSKDYSDGIDHAVLKCDEAAARASGLAKEL